jgi:hypothetical protein
MGAKAKKTPSITDGTAIPYESNDFKSNDTRLERNDILVSAAIQKSVEIIMMLFKLYSSKYFP